MTPQPHKDHLDLAELERLAPLLANVEACRQFVSPEEWAEYERCRDSVVEARRYAERHAHLWWIG